MTKSEDNKDNRDSNSNIKKDDVFLCFFGFGSPWQQLIMPCPPQLIYFLKIPNWAIDPIRALLQSAHNRGAVGKGWGNWSCRGSNLLPLAQRSKHVVFHLCCYLC